MELSSDLMKVVEERGALLELDVKEFNARFGKDAKGAGLDTEHWKSVGEFLKSEVVLSRRAQLDVLGLKMTALTSRYSLTSLASKNLGIGVACMGPMQPLCWPQDVMSHASHAHIIP